LPGIKEVRETVTRMRSLVPTNEVWKMLAWYREVEGELVMNKRYLVPTTELRKVLAWYRGCEGEMVMVEPLHLHQTAHSTRTICHPKQ
jgi:hypothetical protein